MRQMTQSPRRENKVKYRRPYGDRWEELPLDRALDMIADRMIATRRKTSSGMWSHGGINGCTRC